MEVGGGQRADAAVGVAHQRLQGGCEGRPGEAGDALLPADDEDAATEFGRQWERRGHWRGGLLWGCVRAAPVDVGVGEEGKEGVVSERRPLRGRTIPAVLRRGRGEEGAGLAVLRGGGGVGGRPGSGVGRGIPASQCCGGVFQHRVRSKRVGGEKKGMGGRRGVADGNRRGGDAPKLLF